MSKGSMSDLNSDTMAEDRSSHRSHSAKSPTRNGTISKSSAEDKLDMQNNDANVSGWATEDDEKVRHQGDSLRKRALRG